MRINQPYHTGETSIQTLVGEAGIAMVNGRLYEDAIIPAAQKFLALQHFLILCVVHKTGTLSATVIYGSPGFLSASQDGKLLYVDLNATEKIANDPVLRDIQPGSHLGSLGIDLSSRRRVRINGTATAIDSRRLVIQVCESYPNCPKYIQKRTVEVLKNEQLPPPALSSGATLKASHLALIENADTFFVASFNPTGHADVSHRGGNRGFVKILPNGDLKIPDYPGNSMYNTLGNFQLSPEAALLFWDFEHSDLLHLQGTAHLLMEDSDPCGETGGTRRWWTFKPRHWELQTTQIPFHLKFEESSPHNPPAG